MGSDRVGLEVKRIDFFQPGVLVGCEHRIRRAAQRHHLLALEHNLVLEGLEGCAAHRETGCDGAVARDGRRLVVVIGIYRFNLQLCCQRRHFGARIAMAHDQAAAQFAQGCIELGDAMPDELDTPVGACRQRVKDCGVEDKHAIDPAVPRHGVMECGVVVDAQVAAEPDQSGRVGGVFGCGHGVSLVAPIFAQRQSRLFD